MSAPLAGSSDLECLPYQGRDCVRDFSAGGTVSPSVSGPRSPSVTDGPIGHPGTLSSSDLAGMRGPAPSAESAVWRGPVGPAVSSECGCARTVPD